MEEPMTVSKSRLGDLDRGLSESTAPTRGSQRRSTPGEQSSLTAGACPAPLVSIRDVMSYTQQSESTIRRAVRDGYLTGFRMPGGWRFRHADVEAWVAR